jgi:trehalose 6-phosphate phosphatase
VVSGRRLEDVESLAGLAGIWYAGVHGYFLRSPQGKKYSLQPSGRSKEMAQLARHLQRALRGLKGVDVEPKGATVAVHYRRAGRTAAKRARAIVMRKVGDNFALLHGKKVWEFVPAGRGRAVNKWTGIEFILRRTGFRRLEHAAVIYLGDDATDEHVFRNLRGITVAVGKRKRTAARYYLRSTAEVRRFLQLWKEVSP